MCSDRVSLASNLEPCSIQSFLAHWILIRAYLLPHKLTICSPTHPRESPDLPSRVANTDAKMASIIERMFGRVGVIGGEQMSGHFLFTARYGMADMKLPLYAKQQTTQRFSDSLHVIT